MSRKLLILILAIVIFLDITKASASPYIGGIPVPGRTVPILRLFEKYGASCRPNQRKDFGMDQLAEILQSFNAEDVAQKVYNSLFFAMGDIQIEKLMGRWYRLRMEPDATWEDEPQKQFESLLKEMTNLTVTMNTEDGHVCDEKVRLCPAEGDKKSENSNRKENGKSGGEGGGSDKQVVFDRTPTYISGTMREHQVRGLNWLVRRHENGINPILADEMGLGKTLQTISLLGYSTIFKKPSRPHLIVVPLSTWKNWMNELNKWCPTLVACSLIGDEQERNKTVRDCILPQRFDVCVTSYEITTKMKAQLKKVEWEYIVIDEAQRIKNSESWLSEVVRELKTSHRLLLTGTPLQNNLRELWALLNFLMPKIFASADLFMTWFADGNREKVKKLQQILEPFILRRLKSDVEKSLLPKKELQIFVGLSKMQRELYQGILLKDLAVLNGTGFVEKTRVKNVLMELRKVTNHPYLLEGVEPGPPFTTDDHLLENSAKMRVLDRLLFKVKSEGSRVLLFSQFTRMLDVIEDYCSWKDYQFCRIDGMTPHEERQQMIDTYNEAGSKKFIFLLTTRAGGVGINLASADTVIVYDSDWNPQNDLQAQDRAHRIGQTKQVRVYRLIAENTVDERIIERAEMKLRLDRMVIQNGGLAEAQDSLGTGEMIGMLRKDAEKVLEDSPVDEDIDVILQRAERRTAELLANIAALSEDHLGLTLDNDGYTVYNFEGENWKKKQVNSMDKPSIELPKRQRCADYKSDPIGEALRSTRQPRERAEHAERKEARVDGRVKRHPIFDYQFYPRRLHDLLEREAAYYAKATQPKVALDLAVAPPDCPTGLTDEETAEVEVLLKQGQQWNWMDFNNFKRGIHKYGRHDFERISGLVGTKSAAEVERYSDIFWSRVGELREHEEIVDQIVKAEERLEKRKSVKRVLDLKFALYHDPAKDLQIKTLKSKYTTEHDRYLICQYHRLYFSDSPFQMIYESIQNDPQFSDDEFIKSRSNAKLRERCLALVEHICREMGMIGEEDPKD